MQIKLFTIPITGGAQLVEEMNVFLRSKKILQIKEHLVSTEADGSHWCFSVRYVEDVNIAERDRVRVDYKEVLGEDAFRRFAALREIRKKVAQDDSVPAYAVFTDGELAELAKLETLTLTGMKSVKGIGEKKVEKYGSFFVNSTDKNEKSRESDHQGSGSG